MTSVRVRGQGHGGNRNDTVLPERFVDDKLGGGDCGGMAASGEAGLRADTGENGVASGEGDGGAGIMESSTQTDSKAQGNGPRLSKINLFTLLSLWMELFPKKQSQRQRNGSTHATGLVVVHDGRVLGLHCSGPDLHAGQVAVIRHGHRLKDCDLYFSRKPCSTCLKMIINAGVNRISYWPADAEISLLCGESSSEDFTHLQEAVLDAVAADRLKSNSRLHICVLLRPLESAMLQFVEETSRNSDFLNKVAADDPSSDTHELFTKERCRNWDGFYRKFIVADDDEHRDLLSKLGLENFCIEPFFSKLRQHMRDLVRVLACVAASVPTRHREYGFYESELCGAADKPLSQEVVRHCIIQATLLAYRTEDPKVGVGAVIWAEGRLPQCDGTGNMYLVGCGFNAYPLGSEHAEYPQMDDKQEERKNRKYRYIIHAEQNAITFRCAEVKQEENTMMFVTKCPCDECVPLIYGAGIKQVYTSDLDSGRNKHDISYMRFNRLSGVHKFIWQKMTLPRSTSEAGPSLPNGCLKHRKGETSETDSFSSSHPFSTKTSHDDLKSVRQVQSSRQ